MINNKAGSKEKVAAILTASGKALDNVFAHGTFIFKCYDKNGNLKWEDKADNLVVKEGAQYMNDTFFTGSTYTAAWYLGLITGPGSGTVISGDDTLAIHAGWTEYTDYSGNRVAATFGAATLADPSVIATSAASQFSITGAGGTVAGAFLTDVNTGTSGILFSASDFQAPGDRVVVSGDTLNVSYQFSLDQTP